jgi:hypothetical protein
VLNKVQKMLEGFLATNVGGSWVLAFSGGTSETQH